ncbi:MAG: YbbR-like domain-containing protein [Candidatus Marinimicrobia bacterium]|nr:YbbR-like domain-containing protein [Candidatus Neomarinimicrobiota bacterium]
MKKNTIYKKNILSKIVALLMAIVLWIFIVSGFEYTILLEIPIEEYNPISNKILKSNIPEKVSVRLYGSGRSLMIAKYFERAKLILDISLIDKNGGLALNEYFTEHPDCIYLPKKNIKLLDIVYPDSIDIQLDEKISKKIQVRLNSKIELKPGYTFSESITMSKDRINVSGPKSIIDNLDTIDTEQLLLGDVDMSVNKEIELVNPRPELLKLESKTIRVKGKVEIIGEKNISDIIVQGKNIPQNFKVRFVPKTVSLNVIGGNDQIQDLTSREFKVIFDYSKQWMPNKIYYKPIVIIPDNVIKYKEIIPKNIEVIFEKK